MLTLFWQNPNTFNCDEIKVYRASSKEGELSLIATLPPESTEYTDNPPLINYVYWYKIVFTHEYMDDAESLVFPMGYFPSGTGPGPQELLRGSWELGYFGEVNTGLLPSYKDIRIGFKTMTSYPGTFPTTWHKCVAQGNIIYIPDCSLATPYSFISAYNKFFPVADAVTDVINEVTKDGYLFSARPPYLSKNRRNQKVGFESENLISDSEITKWSEMAAVCSVFYGDMPGGLGGIRKVNAGTPIASTIPILSSTPSNQSPYSRWCIDKFPPTAVITQDTNSHFVFVILELLFD